MQFITLASLATAALVSATNTVKFVSLDDVDRTVYWTGNSGMAAVEETVVKAGENKTVEVPNGWIGNFYAVSEGAENKPGMLGEVAFNSWNDLTYFDVSAIVNSEDVNGVQEMYPANDPWTPVSGCKAWPCPNAYYVWDDVQTKATTDTDIVCTLGASGIVSRDYIHHEEWENFPREAVTTRMWRQRK